MVTEVQKAVMDISDSLRINSFTLHAFASLLTTTDFIGFTNNEVPDTYIESNVESHDLKQGLKHIIELHIAHQEKLLNDYMERCYEGNGWLINRASNIISLEESGSYSSRKAAINELIVATAVLDMVLNKKPLTKDGSIEQAKELKATCLERIAELKK